MRPAYEERVADAPVSRMALLLSRMVATELAMAKEEVGRNVRKAIIGAVLLIVALVVVLVSLNMLAGAAVIALAAAGVGDTWAALIVGGAGFLIAVLLALFGLSALKPSNLVPTKTAARVRQDFESLKEMMRDEP
ncbi:phage holin family protein [Falsirhodobacter halotolerans]|uniref:phage holin family protein n=1 Tax=Falsirhodobacter halotolerans TaxID=1146892 RepID=UPI001FD0F708|nr:phage holin family protein [Falsirhodobacter halotolerans]MCJ8140742.1 phage holin family protein [Falsirhodobacter halotolerans]